MILCRNTTDCTPRATLSSLVASGVGLRPTQFGGESRRLAYPEHGDDRIALMRQWIKWLIFSGKQLRGSSIDNGRNARYPNGRITRSLTSQNRQRVQKRSPCRELRCNLAMVTHGFVWSASTFTFSHGRLLFEALLVFSCTSNGVAPHRRPFLFLPPRLLSNRSIKLQLDAVGPSPHRRATS